MEIYVTIFFITYIL